MFFFSILIGTTTEYFIFTCMRRIICIINRFMWLYVISFQSMSLHSSVIQSPVPYSVRQALSLSMVRLFEYIPYIRSYDRYYNNLSCTYVPIRAGIAYTGIPQVYYRYGTGTVLSTVQYFYFYLYFSPCLLYIP